MKPPVEILIRPDSILLIRPLLAIDTRTWMEIRWEARAGKLGAEENGEGGERGSGDERGLSRFGTCRSKATTNDIRCGKQYCGPKTQARCSIGNVPGGGFLWR
jgi:hypothetical protein